MADSTDKILSLAIQLGVMGKEDAKALNDLLAETKGNAADLSQSMPQGWEAMGKYKAALGGAGEGAEGLKHHIHGLRQLMRGAGPEAAELGHLLHFAFNPAFLVGAGGSLAEEAIFKWIEKSQEKYKESVDQIQKVNDEQRKMIAAGPTALDQWKDIAGAIAEARAQLSGLGAELKQFEETAKVYDIAALDALTERQRMRREEVGILESQLELMKAMGQITNEQAEQAKIRLEHEKKLQDIHNGVEKIGADLSLAKTNYEAELKRAGGGGAFSPEAIGAATKHKGDADEAYRRAFEITKDAPGQIKSLEHAIEENNKKAKDNPLDWNKYMDLNLSIRDQIKTLRDEMKSASASLPTLLQEKTNAAADLATIKGLHDKFEGMQQNIRELTQKQIDAKYSERNQFGQENFRFMLEALTSLINTRHESPQQIATAGVASVQRGQRDEHVTALQELLQATGFSNAQIINILNRLSTHHLKLQDVLAGIMQRIAALEAQGQHTGFNGK